jgi:hypothetical protein
MYKTIRKNLEIKCQLDATDDFFQILLLAQHVSGTIMSGLQAAACKPDT